MTTKNKQEGRNLDTRAETTEALGSTHVIGVGVCRSIAMLPGAMVDAATTYVGIPWAV